MDLTWVGPTIFYGIFGTSGVLFLVVLISQTSPLWLPFREKNIKGIVTSLKFLFGCILVLLGMPLAIGMPLLALAGPFF